MDVTTLRDGGARLRLEHVSKRFGRPGQVPVAAVHDVTLEVEPGELVTLLGPSGCGKTTTLRIVAGFEQPDSGRVHIGNRDVTDLMVYRRGIGFVFQNYALFPHLTVFENVAYGLRVKRLADAPIRAKVSEVLDLVGLPGYERRFPNQLSGGEQQRVAVARAVVVEPALLLFDEPLSNLDAKLRTEMRDELSRLQRRLGITAVYVTHDQEEAMALSDRIAVMRRGRIVQLGTAQDLYQAPRSAFVARFIGRVNLLPARVLEVGGGTARVEAWGRPVNVPADGQCAPGQQVLLVLRPEAVGLAPEGGEPFGDGVSIPGAVRARTFLGEKVEYLLDTAAGRIQAVVYDPARRGLLEVGTRARMLCDPGSLRILPADGEDPDEGSAPGGENASPSAR